jgi:hypothetical protein
MKKILSLIFCIICSVYAFGQTGKQLDIIIKVENSEKWRTLNAQIANGSDDYIFVWTCSAPYGISSDRSAPSALIPLDEEDITYEVFVRDQKSGLLGYSSINFSSKSSRIGFSVFPNPVENELQVVLTESPEGENDESIQKVELYSEKKGSIVKSISLSESKAKETKIDVRGIEPGIYFVNLVVKSNKTRNEKRKVTRILINGVQGK